MKKLYLLILALLLTVSFSSYSMTCLAQGGSVTVNGASAKAGEEITVKITAEGIKGINAGSIELKSLPKGVSVSDGEWKIKGAELNHFDKEKRGVFACNEKIDLDGTIFELKLKLGKDAESGDIVCELRFKDGSTGNPDVSGIENIPGKLTVKAESTDNAGDNTSSDTPNDTPNDTPSGDTDKGGKDEVQESHDDVQKGDEVTDGEDESKEEKKLSPVVIALIAVAGVALVAAIVLMATKKKK